MIAFGCSITKPDVYERCAARGFRLAAEPDSEVLAYGATGSIFRSYNLLLDKARELDDLEALVLVHQDAEIVDPEFCPKLRRALEDPEVALVGCAGGTGQHSIAWWEGSVTWASFAHRYGEYGGGEIPALTFPTGANPSYSRTGEVDAIDGVLIGMSPWAIRELSFDESLGGLLHGYDFDLCCQARAAGRKVVTADLRLLHHHTIELIDDVQSWLDAYIKLARKWDTGPSDNGAGWQERARQAEAQAAAAKLLGGMTELVRQAQADRDAKERGELERELERIHRSASWRMTAPFRAFSRRSNKREPRRDG
jgi:GT2 family glycosyltransferase